MITVGDLCADGISTEDAERLGQQLIDGRQRLLAIVRACVASDDVENLTRLLSGTRAVHQMLLATAVPLTRVSELDSEPFQPRDASPVHAGRALAALGLVLADTPERALDHLRVFHRWIDHSGWADPDHAPVRTVPAAVDTPHVATIRKLAEAGELNLLSLVWLAEIDGWDRSRSVRLGPSTQVLLDLGTQGRRATLRLSWAPGLPAGLVPDPAVMTLCSADERFREALAAARRIAGGPPHGTVLWSLTDQVGPVTRVTGESLSLAFAVLLDEQRRLSRRVVGRLTVRRSRARTAIVGRVSPGDPTAALSVAGYGPKLSVVSEDTRIVLPSADHAAALRENQAFAHLLPVDTWRQAARASRAIHRRSVSAIIVICLGLVAATGLGLYRLSESQRGLDQRRALAADLAARSVTMRETDPVLAAKLGLAAHHIAPDSNRATDALRDVLEDNRNVVRSWQADPARVGALAVSEPLDRIVTSGSEPVTRMWALSSGAPSGELPVRTHQMVAAERQAYVAAAIDDGLALFDIGGDTLTELGSLPDLSCSNETEVAAFGFTRNDTNLVVVWKDGAVNNYDVVTRSETSCRDSERTLAPLTFAETLPVNKVVAADVVEGTGDEVVMVLSNNDVISSRSGGKARVEVPRDSFVGDASLVAASPETVSVALPQGVAVWSRSHRTLLANPAGGLGGEPHVLVESHGHLLIGGDAGTALIPLPGDNWRMADSLATPSGGTATVAAISERGMVAGGPGGRISVIAASTGELALEQEITTTATAFLPDGRLLASDVPKGLSDRSTGTLSSGIRVFDPRIGKYPDDPLTRWTYGEEGLMFFANMVVVGPGLVASAGQVRGRGAILVWQGDDHTSPTELLLPPPDEKELPSQEKIIAAIGLTPDGGLLVARHVSGEIGFWTVPGLESAGTLKLPPGNTRMSVRAGRVTLVTGSKDKIELVDVDTATRRIIRRVPAPGAWLMSGTPDGTRTVSMGDDGTIQIRGPELEPLGDSWRPSTSGEPVTAIALDAVGRRLAIAQGDQVLVYDVDTRTLAMPPLQAYGSRVVTMSWSPDGELLTGTTMPPQRGNKQVTPLRVWKTGELDWSSQVCRWAGGGFSRAEWSRYVGSAADYIDLCAKAGR